MIDSALLKSKDRPSLPPLSPTANTPRYLEKTLSITLPGTGYIESSTIRNSFSTGSHLPIKLLPSKLSTGTVQDARTKHMQHNILMKPVSIYKPGLNNREFSPIIYSGTDYDKQSNIRKYVFEDERNNLASSSRGQFLVSSHQYDKNRFGDLYLLQQYQEAGDLKDLTRDSLMDSSRFLHGSFQSTVSRNSIVLLKQPKLMDVKVWIKRMYESIKRDWGHLKFTLQFTAENELLILFDNSNLPPANALLNYMNHFSVHGVAADIGFIKRGDKWYTLQENDKLMFAFYSPGINRGPKNVFDSAAAAERASHSKRKYVQQHK